MFGVWNPQTKTDGFELIDHICIFKMIFQRGVLVCIGLCLKVANW